MTEEKYREMQRKLRNGWRPAPAPRTPADMTRQEFENFLDAKIAAGDMTREEAGTEWLDWMHRDEGRIEW